MRFKTIEAAFAHLDISRLKVPVPKAIAHAPGPVVPVVSKRAQARTPRRVAVSVRILVAPPLCLTWSVPWSVKGTEPVRMGQERDRTLR